MDLKDKIRSIEDYPQKGVIFRDITTLLKDAEGLKDAVDAITASLADVSFDLVLSPESRGFIFGMPVAYNMGKGFVPNRSCRSVKKESFLARQHRSSMIWNMEVQRSRSTSVRSNRETRL